MESLMFRVHGKPKKLGIPGPYTAGGLIQKHLLACTTSRKQSTWGNKKTSWNKQSNTKQRKPLANPNQHQPNSKPNQSKRSTFGFAEMLQTKKTGASDLLHPGSRAQAAKATSLRRIGSICHPGWGPWERSGGSGRVDVAIKTRRDVQSFCFAIDNIQSCLASNWSSQNHGKEIQGRRYAAVFWQVP